MPLPVPTHASPSPKGSNTMYIKPLLIYISVLCHPLQHLTSLTVLTYMCLHPPYFTSYSTSHQFHKTLQTWSLPFTLFLQHRLWALFFLLCSSHPSVPTDISQSTEGTVFLLAPQVVVVTLPSLLTPFILANAPLSPCSIFLLLVQLLALPTCVKHILPKRLWTCWIIYLSNYYLSGYWLNLFLQVFCLNTTYSERPTFATLYKAKIVLTLSTPQSMSLLTITDITT